MTLPKFQKWGLKIVMIVLASYLGMGAGVDRDGKSVSPQNAPTPDEALERYTTNLTRLANNSPGTISPYIGRTNDQLRLLTVFSQKGTQVVYLVGAAGAGKTALVESLANQIRGVEILALDLAKLVAGTSYRGDFEARLNALMQKLVASKGQYILFIDELHQMMKVEGLADILKPKLARGEISFIGATTTNEYREFIEPDSAMTSRGQKFEIQGLTKDEALQMLRSRKPDLVKKHSLPVLDRMLVEAIELAARFYPADPISRRALQIVDETMARINTQAKYGAQAERVLHDQLKQSENERDSLKQDLPYLKDVDLEMSEQRIKDLALKIESLNANIRITSHGGTINGVRLNAIMREMHKKEAQLEDLKRLAKLSRDETKKVESLAQEIKSLREVEIPKYRELWEKEIAEINSRQAVDVRDVRLTVSADRSVPLEGIDSNSQQRIKRFFDIWNNTVFGQDHVRDSVGKIIASREMGIEPNTEKPMVLNFNGAGGVGKNMAGKAIASGVLLDERAFLPLDIGQHQSSAALATLFGSWKGHVNQAEGGVLTEFIRNKPFSVVMLDEFEKGHPDLQNAFFKLFEEGLILDNSGRTVDARNVTFIINTNITQQWVFDRQTMNLQEIEEKYGFKSGELRGLSLTEVDKRVSRALLLRHFSNSFLGRIDLIVNFKTIDLDTAKMLSEKQFKDQAQTLKTKKGIILKYTSEAIEAVAKLVANSENGGREAQTTRRTLITQDLLLTAMDEKNKVQPGQELTIDFKKSLSGGEMQILRNGEVLHKVQLVIPVKLPTLESQRGAVDYRKAGGTEEAIRPTEIIDTHGQPIRSRGKR